MPFATIVDPSDSRLDDYRNIPDAELIARHGMFVAEGRLVVRRLLTGSAFVTRSVMVTDVARASLADAFAERPEVPVYVVPQAVVNGITGVNIHRGCLAIGERPAQMPWRDFVRLKAEVTESTRGFRLQPEVVVILERVANADNVGGVFRNAAAFGADAVLLDPTSTDPLYRKAIRTSMGAALRVPFARAEPWPQALHHLRAEGLALIAMTPSADAPTLRDCVARLADRRVAIVLGHEGEGLTAAALAACEFHARIPMVVNVDSLNVASAAAVALYELQQVRRGP